MSKNQEKEFLHAYDKFSDAIFRFCLTRLWDRDLAKDITQETFMKIWEYLVEGKKIEKMRPFLYQVARNKIIDHFRKKKTQSLNWMSEEGYQFADLKNDPKVIQRNLDAKKALRILSFLSEEERDLVTMRYVEGLKPKEIATILEESGNVVSVRIHRIIKKLKVRIKEIKE